MTTLKSSAEYDNVTRESRTGVTVVRCTAKWCAPCRNIAPAYAKLEIPGASFYTIDVDDVDDFQDIKSAKKLPCFFIFNKGTPAGLILGADLDVLSFNVRKLTSVD